jgi:hypothetical protein
MDAIPTRYNNVNYRSRLEAKWAKFFDLLGWKYEYEPCDFNGWIPDFVLIGTETNVFVEVKPISKFPKSVADKIDISGCSDQRLIVGFTLPTMSYGCLLIGWLNDNYGWDKAPFGQYTNETIGFCHLSGSHENVLTGEYIGNWQPLGEKLTNQVIELWKEAGNSTQWKSVK